MECPAKYHLDPERILWLIPFRDLATTTSELYFAEDHHEEFSAEELGKVENIIEHAAEEKKVSLEKKELEELKEDVEEYKEVLKTAPFDLYYDACL